MSWILSGPWPWYVAGPLIGLMVPLLLLVGGKQFGLSVNLRHMCAAVFPRDIKFLVYDWRREGGWNLIFAVGVIAGGWVSSTWLNADAALEIAPDTRAALLEMGLSEPAGLVPPEIFASGSLLTGTSLLLLVGGGLLIGFGARYAGGCTSGHAIAGLADLQFPSLLAVLGFFAGGLAASHLLLPMILGGAS